MRQQGTRGSLSASRTGLSGNRPGDHFRSPAQSTGRQALLIRIVVAAVVGLLIAAPSLIFAQPPRIETGNTAYGAELRRLFSGSALQSNATRAVAYHNDVEVWLNRQATIVLDSAGCDVQRDYAASLWLRWNDMGVGPGAGVTV